MRNGRYFIIGSLLVALLAAGCGGGGGGGSSTPGSKNGGSQSASGAPAITGTIYALSGNTINLNGGQGCGYVNVTFGSSTTINMNGYSLSPGVFASIWGSGSCATSFTATQITLGAAGSSGNSGNNTSGGSLNHVLTADYLGGYSGTHAVSAAQAAPVLSWAEISPYDAASISGAGIKTLDYIDPFRQATTDPLYTSDESTFSHDCSGNRVTIPYSSSITQYLMNPSSADLTALMNAWEAGQLAIGHLDAFFFDDIDTLYGVPTLPCGATQSTWDVANSSFIAANNYSVVFNGYGLNSDAAQIINVATAHGGVVEGCYATWSQPTPPYTTGSFWVTDENLELAAAAAGKLFFCYNNGSQDGAASTALRQYIYASFLLTYSGSSSVLWDTFTTPSGLHVFPETQLVPTNPVVSAPATVDGLKASSGVYFREYGVCYLNGTSIGKCAAVVNPDSSNAHAIPVLSATYGHTLSLSGYGVLDGGSAGVNGAAPPSTLAAESGLILLP